MTLNPVREFRLAQSEGDGRHAYINEDGAFLGLGVPLLERDTLSKWRPRNRALLERLFAKGYGIPVDLRWRITQLDYVAQALNKHDFSLASISLVRTELPPLPSAKQAWVMAKADGLAVKYGSTWENEPRIPAGNSGGGQWATDSNGNVVPVETDRRLDDGGRIQVADCQGIVGGCQSGGSFGSTAIYNINGKNLCRDCAVKALNIGGLPGGQQVKILTPYLINGK